MNKSIKYAALAMLTFTVAATSSCSREEDDIWDQSAAERMDAAKVQDLDILRSAPNGWEMLYFATNEERGYNFLMKFEGDSVTIATRNPKTNDAYAEQTSYFDVLTDDGMVLSFPTYNDLFHIYADPQPDHSVPSDGMGSNGDYEFKIMSISNDMIYMRGKKHGVEIYMYPLEENVGWEQYFNEIYDLRSRLFNEKIDTLWMTLADGLRFSIANTTVSKTVNNVTTTTTKVFGVDQVGQLLPLGGDAVTQTSKMSYVMTRSGIRWITDFPGDTLSRTPVREFVLNDEGTFLVSTDFGGEECTAGATIKAPSYTNLFKKRTLIWSIDEASVSGNIATAYQSFVNGYNASIIGVTYNLYNIGFKFSGFAHSLFITFGASESYAVDAVLYCDLVEKEDGTIGFSFTGNTNEQGGVMKQQITQLEDLINVLEASSFRLSSASELNPSQLLLTDVNDENNKMCVNIE